MMLSIKEQERLQCQFAAFCKVVLRNAVCTYLRDLGRKRKREISLEYLIEQTSFQAHSTDDYFVGYDTPTDFTVFGQLVTVDNERLAKALLFLSERRRKVILLRYYLCFNDVQISALYGSPRSTIQYQKQAALKQLRKKMEERKDEI